MSGQWDDELGALPAIPVDREAALRMRGQAGSVQGRRKAVMVEMRDGENMQAALERARAGLAAQVMDVYDFQGGGGAKSLLLQAIPENQMKQIEAVDK
eukprot:Cvel_36599.t1-p1 / transcript=Cvel_36599.t1 / gene=Cvel_36599 / organism=Chromera_velia_CCMP2878 / gene_product=hypothetical protein / transcript_product=hypothetical protein / location=Cvel_scaffold7504:799-1091(+) / protein_length=97 / sequence_SO=supercontig / SO=protein_coding / is_pseudo=false